MEISYSWFLVCSVVLIHLWVPVVISRGVPNVQLGTKKETDFNDYEMAFKDVIDADLPSPLSTNDEVAIRYRRMLTPDQQQCNAHQPCPSGRYCHIFLCVECLAEDVACTNKGQCCRGQCSYGRCKGSSAPRDPGTFCDSKQDCRGDSCCVREPSLNPYLSICQPTLGESFTCVNRSQNVYVGGVEEVCGPCKAGLVCKTVGTFDVHEICLPK